MRLTDLIWKIRALRFYSDEEWDEYLGSFEGVDHPINPPPCNRDDLVRRICRLEGAAPVAPDIGRSPKILDVDQIARRITREKTKLGVVSGAFDLLHLNHIRGFRHAREHLNGFRGSRLCAMTLADSHISVKKGSSRPVLNINDRLTLLTGIRYIDYILPLKEPDCLCALERLKPAFFYKRKQDFSQDPVRREIDILKSLGGSVCWIPVPKCRPISTTILIEDVRRRYAVSATGDVEFRSGTIAGTTGGDRA